MPRAFHLPRVFPFVCVVSYLCLGWAEEGNARRRVRYLNIRNGANIAAAIVNDRVDREDSWIARCSCVYIYLPRRYDHPLSSTRCLLLFFLLLSTFSLSRALPSSSSLLRHIVSRVFASFPHHGQRNILRGLGRPNLLHGRWHASALQPG